MLTFRAMIRAMIALPGHTFVRISGVRPNWQQQLRFPSCDTRDSLTCPTTVKANAGDSYEMSGTGTFDARNKSVNGAGNFTHKSRNGRVLETGVWIASEFQSGWGQGTSANAWG